MKRSFASEFGQDDVSKFPRFEATPRSQIQISQNGFAVHNGNSHINSTGCKSTGEPSQRQEQEQSQLTQLSAGFGKSILEKTYIFTGSADRVIKWHRIFKHRSYFEVISSLIAIREGSVRLQSIILLKDAKGPVLQVVHYKSHEIGDEEFHIGEVLRCVGYMTGPNTLTAISVRKAVPEEVATLKRNCYIGDFTISGLINAEENRIE